MPAPLPTRRYLARRPRPASASLEGLADAIHTLHQASSAGDPLLIARGLQVLSEHLGASLATLVTVSGAALDTRWWHPETGPLPEPVRPFCEWLSAHPERMLVVPDMAQGPHLNGAEEVRHLAHRAALGCALRHGNTVKALLFTFFDAPRPFSRMDFALLEAVGGFLGQMLAAEDLKQSVHRLEDALAITQAVMEDSSIRDPETDLPNLRYLEIWQRTLLTSDPRPTSLVVAECRLALQGRRDVARLRKAAEGVRASDLLVRAGPDRFLAIFRNTPRALAHAMLLRLRTQLGNPPLGATVWVPGPSEPGWEACQPRLDAALAESRATVLPSLAWRLPEGLPPEPPEPSREPRPWQPPVIRRT